MFCPHCGAEITDGSPFCDICGESTDAAPKAQSTVFDAGSKRESKKPDDAITTITPYSIAVEKQSKKRGGGHRLAIGVIVVVLVAALVGSFAFFGGVEGFMNTFGIGGQPAETNSGASAEPTNDSQEASSPTAAGADANSGLEAKNQQSAASDDGSQRIAFDNVLINKDSLGRFYMTGKVTNLSDEEYTADFQITAQEHKKGKDGGDSTRKITVDGLESVTPRIVCNRDHVRAFHLDPGESLAFQLYSQYMSDADISYTDLEAVLVDVTLPGSVQNRFGICVDKGECFEVKDLKYNSDGKVTGTLTNKSKKSFTEVQLVFVMKDASGDYSVEKASGTRPAGVVVKWGSVNDVSSGDSIPFEINVGKDYHTAILVHIGYKLNTSKQEA